MTHAPTYDDELKAAKEALDPQTTREHKHCEFIAKWEVYLQDAPMSEIQSELTKTSPHHPSENMRWLYDRLLTITTGL